jgi:hypothetical protein
MQILWRAPEARFARHAPCFTRFPRPFPRRAPAYLGIGSSAMPEDFLDPPRAIELQGCHPVDEGPRTVAIQGFGDCLMREKTLGVAGAGELSRPHARLILRGRRLQVCPQDIHVPRRAKQTRQVLDLQNQRPWV